MTEAQKRQAQIDRINQRLGTSPEFAKKVNDYFSNPSVIIESKSNNSTPSNNDEEEILPEIEDNQINEVAKQLAKLIKSSTK